MCICGVLLNQVEGAFSQPNGQMCAKMLAWGLDVTRGSEGDLLELYCGNANFTVPLAQNFRYDAFNSAQLFWKAILIKGFHILSGMSLQRDGKD